MNDALGVTLGFFWVFGVIGLSTALQKAKLLNDEAARKLIHILVGFWFIIAMMTIESTWHALIAPVFFVALNYASYKFNLIKAMEREHQSENDLGTVYYVITLAIVTLVAWEFGYQQEGAFVILLLAFGDGLSALLGQRFPSIKLYKDKSLVGFLTVLISALVLGFIFIPEIGFALILLAFIAAFIELVTPKGLDNLTLPLAIFVLVIILGGF